MWRVVDDEGTTAGRSTRSSRTPPAPQTADLLGQAAWEHGDCRDLRKSIAQVPFRTILSVVLHYPFELDVPYYALVNDGEGEGHEVGWIAREECKPGHVPDGESLLLVQMAPDWSAEYYHEPAPSIVDAAADKTAALLDDERLGNPTGPTTSTGATRCPTADPPSARSTTPPNTTSFRRRLGRGRRARPRGGPERSRNGRRGRGPVLRRVRSGFASRTALHYHGPEAGADERRPRGAGRRVATVRGAKLDKAYLYEDDELPPPEAPGRFDEGGSNY